MIYETLGDYVCRKADLSDLPKLYEFLSPFITESSENRKLSKLLKFYTISYNVIVVEYQGNIVGAITGRYNEIHHIGSTGKPNSIILLLYVLLCGIHNKYEESEFKPFSENKNIFENIRTPEGNACIINDEGKGIIPPSTKKYIEQLFRRFKNE